VLLVGAGEMIGSPRTHFAAQQRAAWRWRTARWIGLNHLRAASTPSRSSCATCRALAGIDIIISCTASSLPIIGKGTWSARSALAATVRYSGGSRVPPRHRAEVAGMDDVFPLYHRRTSPRRAPGRRRAPIGRAQAEAIIESEVGSFLHWMKTRELVPLIRQLRDPPRSRAAAKSSVPVRMLAGATIPRQCSRRFARPYQQTDARSTEALQPGRRGGRVAQALVARLYRLRGRLARASGLSR